MGKCLAFIIDHLLSIGAKLGDVQVYKRDGVDGVTDYAYIWNRPKEPAEAEKPEPSDEEDN